MNEENKSAGEGLDPAAVFAAALSLWEAGRKDADKQQINLSELFCGGDQFMREVMAVANQFERWACLHINFTKLDEVWPYLLEEKFGKACLDAVYLSALSGFDDADCLRVAMRLQLPVKIDGKLPVPVEVLAINPHAASGFKKFRIQTVRDYSDRETAFPYTFGDEPFDEEFGQPYFGIYGIGEDGLCEFIASRVSYVEAATLVRNFAPGIDLPDSP